MYGRGNLCLVRTRLHNFKIQQAPYESKRVQWPEHYEKNLVKKKNSVVCFVC